MILQFLFMVNNPLQLRSAWLIPVVVKFQFTNWTQLQRSDIGVLYRVRPKNNGQSVKIYQC